jgi:hypothetical protein
MHPIKQQQSHGAVADVLQGLQDFISASGRCLGTLKADLLAHTSSFDPPTPSATFGNFRNGSSEALNSALLHFPCPTVP